MARASSSDEAKAAAKIFTEGTLKKFKMATQDVYFEEHVKLYSNAYSQGYTDGYSRHFIEADSAAHMPIAIVGMSCRLPGNVTTPDEFWGLLSRARDGWSKIPKERFDTSAFQHPNPGKNGCFNAAGGNFLKEDLGLFDAPFFGLTAQEATSMDPQQRILLECTFEALDSAGIPKHEIVGKEVGVFVGGTFSEYEAQLFQDTDTIPMYQATGCAFAMQSNRLSHFFDLRGPSFTMDTACSSSLVALHQACQSLREGESTLAIVGGCHLNISPENWVSMSNSRLFSDEGRSFSFDSRGTGYGRGEGCGIMILKPLDQALKDNDIIRSVIHATGINQDGRTPGITMPNESAQVSLIKSVYAKAGLDPRETGYVEAHGTGTKVGDPIEAAALHAVFGEGRSPRNPLFIGSVKSNIGHLEAASGIVSVIKTALMLERGFILPNYDFQKPNTKIPLAKWNLKESLVFPKFQEIPNQRQVPISQRPWPRPKRFASVNNFGFGGTNAHVVMERAPFLVEADSDSSLPQSNKLIVLSANDKVSLETMMKQIGIYLEQRPEVFQNDLMSNVAYTLGQRRSLMQWRVAIPTTSSINLIQALNSGKVVPAREAEAPRIGFVFTGQGAQWHAMGRGLYEQYPVFATAIDACEKSLTSFGATFSLIEELGKDEGASQINESHISQPACTAIQIALTDLLRSWGVAPSAVTGHSSGEISAAYAAGILPLRSCMAASYYRGLATILLRKKHPELRGSMMAVGCTKEEIAPFLDQLSSKSLRIACYNSPASLTISGDESAIDELRDLLENKRLFNRKLQVDVAYHSHHMELVAEDYSRTLQCLDTPRQTDIKFHSSLLGQPVDGTELQTSYWAQNLTQSVRFSEALASMCEPTGKHKTAVNVIIEIGPHSALAGPTKQILKACGSNAAKISYFSALIRQRDAVETCLELASSMFTKGASLNFKEINFPKPGKMPSLLVDMPRYSWNHGTKYWHESRIIQKHKTRSAPRHDLLGVLANYSNDIEPVWKNVLRLDDLPWLRHHQIQGLTLFPMSAFVSMAVEAASQKAATRNVQYDEFQLRNITVDTPLMLNSEDTEITLTLRPYEAGLLTDSSTWDEFRVNSWVKSKGWIQHCKGLVSLKSKIYNGVDGQLHQRNAEALLISAVKEISAKASSTVDKTKMYEHLARLGVSYGPSFQGTNNCKVGSSCSTGSITAMDTMQEMPQNYQNSTVIHPALLEQLVEMYWPILGAADASLKTIYLPSSIGRITISRDIKELTSTPGSTLDVFCKSNLGSSSLPQPVQSSMFATSPTDRQGPVILVKDLTVSPIIERETVYIDEKHRELCYKLDWELLRDGPEGISSNGNTNGHSHDSQNGTATDAPNGTNGTSQSNGKLVGTNSRSIMIIHGETHQQQLLASNMADEFECIYGERPTTTTLLNTTAQGKHCIFITELEKPLLSSLATDDFLALQKMLTTAEGVLWVVRGAYGNAKHPDNNMILGLSRSIRSETLLKFATLDLDPTLALDEAYPSNFILQLFKRVFDRSASIDDEELEFMERNGVLFTPRIVDDADMNEYVHKETLSSKLESVQSLRNDRTLQLSFAGFENLKSLHFVDQPVLKPLPADEIEIKIKAVGMNPSDLTFPCRAAEASGVGQECSGIVTCIGNEVTNFSIGDRVAALVGEYGSYASITRTRASLAFQIIDDVSFEVAASFPVSYSTAYHALSTIGDLENGDKVLIHGATSAVGQAAVSLSKTIGAEVFATVNDIHSKNLLQNSYGLDDEHIFSSQQPAFGSPHLPVVDGTYFDVVLNCQAVNADTLQDLWESVASFGCLIDLIPGSSSVFLDTSRNKSFTSFTLESLISEKPKAVARLLSSVSGFLNGGLLSFMATPTMFPISDIENALRVLQKGDYSGKMVILPGPEDMVLATPSKNKQNLLEADATYILIGGTGGLGRSMADWMVTEGARNIVLVSRSGSDTGKVKSLIDEAAVKGAKISVRQCDVANSEAVENLVRTGLAGLPDVRGVIHGAMVLHDVLFENMTHDQYSAVVESKVKGAWNFHHALKKQTLDFFIAISSAAGAVGNRGQAAYSAANTFLNAFVQYRVQLGLPASSLDLTAISDVGYLAEDAEAAAEVAKNLGSDTVCKAEVLALLKAAIDGTLARTCNNHTITGMRITPKTPFWTSDAKFRHLRLAAEAINAANSTAQAATISYSAQLKAAESLPEAQSVVCNGLLSKLPSLLMLEAEDMDVSRSLSDYALDSLVAIELRNFITREFESNLQVLELLSSGSIESLAKAICAKSKLVSAKE